ncbi:MAG: TonB-dependent receptor [Reichenbachiella sp.]
MKKRKSVLFHLLVLGFWVSSFSVYGQVEKDILQTKIIVNSKRPTVRYLLENVFPHYEVRISYHDNIIPLKKKIEIKKSQPYTVEAILELICQNEDLNFETINNQVFLKYYQRPDHEYKYTIYGRVKDSESGESLLGATVYIKSISSGVATNGYGMYSITIPKGTYELKVSYVGYKTTFVELELNKNLNYEIGLQSQPIELKDVTIDDTDFMDLKSVNILSSSNHLDMEMAQNIPYLGEVDVFQGSLLLPGITNIGEGVAGINVRGGNADQNLYMLDEAVVYNANHLFGLVSVFNPDNVQDVEILKGDLPAKYGGRNSSVMHIRQKSGNENEFHLSGGLGLITSRLMVEGPVFNRSASYLVSARSTFWNLLLQNSRNPTINGITASFQDVNAKMKFNINNTNKIYFSGYLGTDANKFGPEALKRWGNQVFSARWNRIIKNKHFLNLTSYYSQYRYRVINENEFSEFVGESQISDIGLKMDMTSYVSPKFLMDYGVSFIFHKMDPGERIPGPGSGQNEVILASEYGVEPSIYFSTENQWSQRITTSLGLRLSSFFNTGSADHYRYELDMPKSPNTITDTLTNGAGKEMFWDILPRLSVKYQINSKTALKLGYFQTVQYMHLLSNTISPSSSDTWKISGLHIPATTMRQSTLGFYRHFTKLDFDMSAELFYKKLNNTIEYKDGADLLFNPTIETELLFGEERVVGLELFVKKSFGKLKGWVGYTLSRSEKRIVGEFEEETINNGLYYPTDYDRTHDISITGIYAFSEKFSVSSNFVYYTGRPYSFPDSKYNIDGILVPHFPNRNQDRLTGYNRLDISATLNNSNVKKDGSPRRFESSWVFSIYNVYNRRNAQAFYFTHTEEDVSKPEVQRLSVLGIIPTVTYNFKF